jgi:protein-tyrosine phosphatase
MGPESVKRFSTAAATLTVLVGLLTGCTVLQPASPTILTSPNPRASEVQPASKTLEGPEPLVFEVVTGITSVSNFRDVAGTGGGLELSDGGLMARGVVYRSGKLKPISEEDREALERVGLTDIFDLRTDEVAERTRDPRIGNASYHLVNLFAVESRPSWKYSDADDARAEREAMNREFVTDPAQRAKTAQVLEGIASAAGPVIIHCTEGKDRTGWISALLQLVAGVDEDQVVREYMLSNDFRRDAIEKSVAKDLKKKGATQAAITRVRLEVEPEFLLAGLDQMSESYGSLDEFLTEGLNMAPQTIDRLRVKLRRG